MKRPDIETLEAAAKAGKRAESDYGQSIIRRNADVSIFEDAAMPEPILELIRYVKVLEKALQIYDEMAEKQIVTVPQYCIDKAERELYPEVEP